MTGSTWEDNGNREEDHNMAAGGGQLVQQLEHLVVGGLRYDLLLGTLCKQHRRYLYGRLLTLSLTSKQPQVATAMSLVYRTLHAAH